MTLVLLGYLSWYTPGQASEVQVEVEPGTTVRAAAVLAGLPPDQVAMGILDNHKVDLEAEVSDGQQIALLPPIGGG
ncbi:MAG TPA: MoaD/ThiS family protein [Symbiobacteriaceae bacterium]|nr:MoaD/ThiS family protein [Symbiobacteriaceae bacterium]